MTKFRFLCQMPFVRFQIFVVFDCSNILAVLLFYYLCCGPDVEELVVVCIRLDVMVADLLLYRHCCSSCGSVTEFQICISSVASGHILEILL